MSKKQQAAGYADELVRVTMGVVTEYIEKANDTEGEIDETEMSKVLGERFTPVLKKMLPARKRKQTGPKEISGYNLFVKDRFRMDREQAEKEQRKPQESKDMMKQISLVWQGMSEEQKSEWRSRSQELNKQTKQEWAENPPADDTQTAVDDVSTVATKARKGKSRTGYNMFQSDPSTRERAGSMVTEGQADTKSKATSKMWAELSDEEKQVWKDEAAEANSGTA